ncbi:hypothetical protein COO60DRAFT_1297505 [Scenedesmus sp. NREL 46B-D3]|nr:hypothetical protein COO60DRAFT_1297505 [Scenedesmus sp. NREL 46B-D3]
MRPTLHQAQLAVAMVTCCDKACCCLLVRCLIDVSMLTWYVYRNCSGQCWECRELGQLCHDAWWQHLNSLAAYQLQLTGWYAADWRQPPVVLLCRSQKNAGLISAACVFQAIRAGLRGCELQRGWKV